MSRQMTEEHEIRKIHVTQQTELMKKLMEDAQTTQLKEMELRQVRLIIYQQSFSVDI